jgi:hypothetical protein
MDRPIFAGAWSEDCRGPRQRVEREVRTKVGRYVPWDDGQEAGVQCSGGVHSSSLDSSLENLLPTPGVEVIEDSS